MEKKKEIISKTAELLSLADGNTEITTRRIAENAGINPAMVNYYFGSKDGLLKEAISAMSGGHSTDAVHEQGGSRKAMFDLLIRACDSSNQCARFGLRQDIASFSGDAFEISSKLIEMKGIHDREVPDEEDAAAVFKTVCFLMTASADPEGFAVYSGMDIRVKGQLRLLVSKQLDALLGDVL
ncbi:MAG: TetR/AcrR family transcriptional regulator [Methanomassiliicoccaceae archaeon]|nr:TetR/AcrR family transcriptional regulator [Methanomassiliicoccaceae archaeon]